MIVPELLSPVGNQDHLKIAVLSGVVYIYLDGNMVLDNMLIILL